MKLSTFLGSKRMGKAIFYMMLPYVIDLAIESVLPGLKDAVLKALPLDKLPADLKPVIMTAIGGLFMGAEKFLKEQKKQK